MPLNAATYLTEHGWAGKGVPLDGAQGRGLKKPLALPMKRNVKGLGKERDRAVEWWDCVFEAGAKKLGGGASGGSSSNDAAATAATMAADAASDSHLSLESRAKRAHARRMLMSGFVRGRPDERHEKQQAELERLMAQQQKPSSSSSTANGTAAAHGHDEGMGKASDAGFQREKQGKSERKAQKSARTAQHNVKKDSQAEPLTNGTPKDQAQHKQTTDKAERRRRRKEEQAGEDRKTPRRRKGTEDVTDSRSSSKKSKKLKSQAASLARGAPLAVDAKKSGEEVSKRAKEERKARKKMEKEAEKNKGRRRKDGAAGSTDSKKRKRPKDAEENSKAITTKKCGKRTKHAELTQQDA